ncbi:metal/formaldehyde-sensitive transcriptional repressor [Pendulispora brunnea]|uniref:Metal/formaldehyde-sensitive transcriptional repressor n=1 Tax=Pendulispora brunnea TaxID=2905690 RepID=A0ABZ2KRU2_9BACT
MAHTARNKVKLLQRVRRIKGQIEAVERALVEERECGEVMQLLAACRGAIGSLTAEVLEGHVRSHMVNPDADTAKSRAARELIDVVKTYMR